MTELGTLSVKLTAATAEFARKMKGVQEKMRGVAETAKKVSKIAAVAFAGMAASLAVVARAYDKQIRAERGLEAAFKAQGKAIDTTRLKELASALQRVTLFGDEVTLANMKMLASFGISEGGIARLIPGMQDLASAMEVDLKTATMAVGKAMAGQAGSLSRYGISLSKAQLEAMKLGNEQQRLSILTGALASFQGQAAIAASTAAGRFTQLSNNFGDVLEVIGEIVDEPLAAVLNTISVAVTQVGAFIKGLSPEFKLWAGRIALVVTVLTAVVAGATALIAISPAIIGAVGALAAAFGVLSATLWPIVLGIAAIAVVIAGVILWVGMLKKVWDENLFGMRDTLTKFVNTTKDAWKWWAEKAVVAWEWWADRAKELLGKVSGWIQSWIQNTVKGLGVIGEALGIETLAGLKDIKIEFSGEALKKSILDIGDFWSKEMKKGADFVVESWAEGLGIAKELLAPLLDKLSELVDIKLPEMPGAGPPGDGVGDSVGALGDSAEGASKGLDAAAQAVGQFGEGGGLFADILRGFAEGGFIGAIISAFFRIIKPLSEFQLILNAFGEFLRRLSEGFKPVLSAITPLIVAILDIAGVLIALLSKFDLVWFLLIALAPLIELLAQGISWVANAIRDAWNWIVGVLASVLGAIPGIGDDLERFIKGFAIPDPADFGTQADIMGFWGTDTPTDLDNLGGAAQNAAEGMRELSESMGNVPSGFKVAFARFEASDPLNIGLGGGPMALAGGGGFNIDTMNVYSDDPDELAEAIQDESEWQGFADTGAPGAAEEERYSGGTRHRL